MNFKNAEKQFNENFRLFSNPKTLPEKYNLYAGLGNMAKGMQNLEEKIEEINQRLYKLELIIRK